MKEPYEAWLSKLSQMIPGIRQAVLITHSTTESDSVFSWPSAAELDHELVSAANLAASQGKSVTTALSSGETNDSTVDMIIALPMTKPEGFTGTVAILANIKPSQQSVVMQILRWGEEWLELLLHSPQDTGAIADLPAPLPRRSVMQARRSHLIALAVLLFVVAMSLMTGTYRVTAPANLEGKIQRVIVAPIDGFIAQAYARAGEPVAAGDVIAELDSQELVLQQQRYEAEKNEYTRQYRKALGQRDQTQALIFKSQMDQAEAQLNLLDKQIQRSLLRSSIDGVIISGDLSRSLGAPVATGDILFEVAPLDEYRLIVLVSEKQVVDVKEGLSGTLNLKALPDRNLPFVIQQVSPVFTEDDTGIAYRVEARLIEHHPELRPGMEGVAKIDINQRSFAWIYLHELTDLIRFWVWRWLP